MSRIPTIIVHGSLGSGKTTLVVSLLKDSLFQNSFVIENEFANENIDKHTIRDHQHIPQVYDIAGGCICCSSGQELSGALAMLAEKQWSQPLIIETTGVAQSAQLLKQLYLDTVFSQKYQLIKNIYILDPLEIPIAAIASEHFFDVALSDVVVIGKTDLVKNEQQIDTYKQEVRRINPEVLIITVRGGNHNVQTFDFSKGSKAEQFLLRHLAAIPPVAEPQHGMRYVIERVHKPVERHRLESLGDYIQQHADQGIKRIKGYVFDSAQAWWHVEATAHHVAVTPSTERSEAVVVAIGAKVSEHFIIDALYRDI